ncbi:MAG: transposase [Bacteroidales bacterium]
MGRPAKEISLCTRVKEQIENLSNSRNQKVGLYKRLCIIKYSSEGYSNNKISEVLRIDNKTVSKWRIHWYNYNQKNNILQNESGEESSDKELQKTIKNILSDAYRSGCPRRLKDKEIQRLIALACEDPQQHGLPIKKWTHITLSNRAKELGIQISATRYGLLLKNQRITTS